MDQGTALLIGAVGVTGTLLGTLIQPIVEELRAVFARRRQKRERRAEFQRTTLLAIREELATQLGASGLAIVPDEVTLSVGRLRVLTESAEDEALRTTLREYIAMKRQREAWDPAVVDRVNERLGVILRRQGEAAPAEERATGRGER